MPAALRRRLTFCSFPDDDSLTMQAYQLLFIGTGALITGLGLWWQLSVPRMVATHAADVASREPVVGEVDMGY